MVQTLKIGFFKKELSNPNFYFFRWGDPCRSYYEHKVAEYARGLTDVNVIEQEPLPETQQV